MRVASLGTSGLTGLVRPTVSRRPAANWAGRAPGAAGGSGFACSHLGASGPPSHRSQRGSAHPPSLSPLSRRRSGARFSVPTAKTKPSDDEGMALVRGHARGLHFGEVGWGGMAGVGDSCGGSISSLWSPTSHICPTPPAHHHRGLRQNVYATSRRHREFGFAAATLRHALSQGRSPIGWTRPNRVPRGGTSAHASANAWGRAL